MKRLISVLLALMLALALCGCSGAKTTAPSDAVGPTEDTTAVDESTAPEDGDVTLGVIENGVYTNTYAGFACSLDERWQYYTAEELQDLSALTQEKLRDSALAEQAGEYAQITDMMAECYDDLTTININYTRLGLQERAAYALMSEEALIDLTLEQKDLLVQTYADAGIDVTSMDKKTVTFLGEEHCAVYTVASIEGTPYYILQLFRHNLGGQYYVALTLASFVEDNTDGLLDLFSAA